MVPLTVSELNEGLIDPLATPWLCLRVFEWPARGYISVDNRRLWCLRRHQERVGVARAEAVYLRARVFNRSRSWAGPGAWVPTFISNVWITRGPDNVGRGTSNGFPEGRQPTFEQLRAPANSKEAVSKQLSDGRS